VLHQDYHGSYLEVVSGPILLKVRNLRIGYWSGVTLIRLI